MLPTKEPDVPADQETPSSRSKLSGGKTEEEALANIEDAIRGCLEVRAARGMPLTVATHEVEIPV
jgi:predicted RNase H-like HicB family nuclease